MKRTILIVDDEQNVRDIAKAYLDKAGYKVLEAENGEEALKVFENNQVHLMVLDIMMPKLNGMEVLEEVRKTSDVPVIMLTAKVGEQDLINGMTTGADDYVRKPFSMRELMVRIEAMIRRTYKNEGDEISLDGGRIMVNISKMQVRSGDEYLELTPNEFKILGVFIENAELVLTREQLIEKAFGMNFDGFDRTVDTHIKNLRHKIEENPKKPTMIKTVYGMGYQFFRGDK